MTPLYRCFTYNTALQDTEYTSVYILHWNNLPLKPNNIIYDPKSPREAIKTKS